MGLLVLLKSNLLDDERQDGNAETVAVVESIEVLLQQLDEVVADACMEVLLRPLHLLLREVPACFEAPEAEEVCLFEQCADTFEVGLVGS